MAAHTPEREGKREGGRDKNTESQSKRAGAKTPGSLCSLHMSVSSVPSACCVSMALTSQSVHIRGKPGMCLQRAA